MRLKRIAKFTKAVTQGLLPSQQALLSQVVCGVLCCRSLMLAEIARGFETTVAFPHNLKRVERYVSNPRLQSLQCKQVVARRLLRQLHHRLQLKPRQPLEIIDEQGFGYVVRVKGDACVEVGRYRGKLRDYPLQVGQCFKLREVTY